MIPRGARLISPGWWAVLSNLIFLRHTSRHYKGANLPLWCEQDALLGERLESLAFWAKAFQDDREQGQVVE
eukprot:5003835-Karenia_brevis.AAC.1